MKVLILFCCLSGVGLLATQAYARTVQKDATPSGQYKQLNLNNNNNSTRNNNNNNNTNNNNNNNHNENNNNNNGNNNNNKHFQLHPIEALVATLKRAVNAANTLETITLEPPHTTKRAITLSEKRPSRPNSKFLRRPEDANAVGQHIENNDELELVENTTESPKRILTTAAPSSKNTNIENNNNTNNENKNNNDAATPVDHNRLTAKLRKHKKQEVGNETPAEVEQQNGAEVSTPIVGGAAGAEGVTKKTGKKQRKQKQKGAQKQPTEEKGNLHTKKVRNKNENNVEKVNVNIKNKKSSNNAGNKVNVTKKPSSKPKQQPLKTQNKQKNPATLATKTNRKANTGLNRNRNTFSKRTPKKAQTLRRPANRRNKRRNRFNAPYFKFSRRTPKNTQSFRRFSNRRGRRRNRFNAPYFRRRRNRWRN